MMKLSRFGIFTFGSVCASIVSFSPMNLLREKIGAEGIDLLVGQRARLRPGHGAPDVVEHRGRVGPEIGDGLVGLDAVGGQRWAPTSCARRRPCRPRRGRPRISREDRGALGRGSAAGRQVGAVGQDGDVPGLDVGLGDRLAECGTIGERGAAGRERARERSTGGGQRCGLRVDMLDLPFGVDRPSW